MRTTISLDDRLAGQVKRKAAAADLSVSAFIARVLDDALKRRSPEPEQPFRLVTVDGDGPAPGVDLDRIRALDVAGDEARHDAAVRSGTSSSDETRGAEAEAAYRRR